MIGRIPRRVGFTPFRHSRVVRDECFSLRLALDPAAGGVRLAFSTPKRIGSAVVRNRARRQARELMRARSHQLPAGWYLLGIERAAVDKHWGQLGMMLDRVIDRALKQQTNASNTMPDATTESM